MEETCNALSWVHSCAGLITPSSHLLLRATLEGLQRELAKPIVKKKPIMVDMLKAIVADANGSGTPSDLRLATVCLLEYAGFFRFQEIVDLRACDCTIEGKMLKVYITSSKNDQLRQGDEVLIASTCPVAMLECYMERTGIRFNDQCFLFRAIQNTK